ncbi:uncharacterized protein SPAPADRAFT_59059 [Spathaspora passalidarum NRRL Y-27907]|uniref:DNA replication complex GINS protein SLD5 n=1 Tax=Spathaspora passalidarum (strain NRRL Y-27907 / 11-Y1) TaxID=619300 RepID=G3AIC1_SPAPN|nr:uncharacterized protein SPAPADRAFT_59059 [Spathaspora passalidarum NRRL Y-27907]EGW33691.1 hypothetical protein SPAPADRAFT_59059 [Spathaspora passalidarum NRRL Y-27907]
MNIDDILQEFEESETPVTSNIHNNLITAMINERMSPELLPFAQTTMTTALTAISNQQQYLIDSHEYGDSVGSTSEFKLNTMIIETEIERLCYLVRMYLRTRLSKLDKFTIYYINEEQEDSKLLSAEEKEYIHKYAHLLTQLYNNCFLKKVPPSLTLLDDTSGGQSMITTPDTNQHVFVKSVTSKPITLFIDNDDIELKRDGIYVVKYGLVKQYIELGDVILI